MGRGSSGGFKPSQRLPLSRRSELICTAPTCQTGPSIWGEVGMEEEEEREELGERLEVGTRRGAERRFVSRRGRGSCFIGGGIARCEV